MNTISLILSIRYNTDTDTDRKIIRTYDWWYYIINIFNMRCWLLVVPCFELLSRSLFWYIQSLRLSFSCFLLMLFQTFWLLILSLSLCLSTSPHVTSWNTCCVLCISNRSSPLWVLVWALRMFSLLCIFLLLQSMSNWAVCCSYGIPILFNISFLCCSFFPQCHLSLLLWFHLVFFLAISENFWGSFCMFGWLFFSQFHSCFHKSMLTF